VNYLYNLVGELVLMAAELAEVTVIIVPDGEVDPLNHL